MEVNTTLLAIYVLSIIAIGTIVFFLSKRSSQKSKEIYEAPRKEFDELLEKARARAKEHREKSATEPIILTRTMQDPAPTRKKETQSLSASSIKTSQDSVNSSDFALSLAVAAATDSALIGMAIGGDPIGAMIGDALNDSDSNKSFMESDSGSSHDSSWDSSDSSSSSSDWSSSDSSSSDWSSSDSSSSSSDW